jgi:pyruvate-ferredoxin/flavodoxin oxidoreductase
MRKMADGFAAVRRAELELADAYDPAIHDPFFEAFDWRQLLRRGVPPLPADPGDRRRRRRDARHRLPERLAPARLGQADPGVVLDTQVYSNTGGQACTSGFIGQVSDMAAYGKAQHGKPSSARRWALIAMAHRGAFVLQSSQASPRT